MIKKIITFIIAIFFIVAIDITTVYIIEHTNKDNSMVLADEGVIDLSNVNLNESKVVPLNGQWEFYPNVLLSSDIFIKNEDPIGVNAQLMSVPSNWKNEFYTDMSAKEVNEFGTYHLKVILNDEQINEVMGIKTTVIRMANTVFINGEEIIKSGQVSDSKDGYIMNLSPMTGFFKTDNNELDIVIHVSNFSNRKDGGISQPIYIGESQQITSFVNRLISINQVQITSSIIMGLFFIGLFALRTNHKELLYFGLYAIIQGVYASIQGERIIATVFSGLEHESISKMQYIIVALCSVFLALYVYELFKQRTNKYIIGFLVIPSIIFAIMAVFLPLDIRSDIEGLVVLWLLATAVYAIYILTLAIIEKERGSVFIFLTITSLSLIAVKNAISYDTSINSQLLQIVDPFVMMLSQALYYSLTQKDAYNNLNVLSQRLEASDKIKTEFLAKTSHEFKSPLNGIKNIVQSIIDGIGGPVSQVQEENLTLVTTVTDQLSNLVNDILDVTEIEYGGLQVLNKEVNLVPLINNVVQIYDIANMNKNINLNVDCELNEMYILGDENRIRQILNNLIENALRFTDEGSITISVSKLADNILLNVCDSGIGITRSVQQKLFNPFVQGDQTRGTKHQGLGLNIVKQLVELQGGTIEVESVVNQGTCFNILFPALESYKNNSNIYNTIKENKLKHDQLQLSNTLTEASKQDNYKYKAHIVVVDDEYINLKATSQILMTAGYEVASFQSGQDALEYISHTSQIDLVITDLMMPIMSGIVLCKKIRETKSETLLPILVATVATSSIEVVSAFNSGANDYINKPFDKENLLARVASLIKLKNSINRMVKSEMALLHAQIKPHFLYNTLNTILSCSYSNVEESRTLIGDLSDFLRGSVDLSSVVDLIPLSRELEHTKYYLNIEKARFGSRLNIEIVGNPIKEYYIPPFTIQTLVENGIGHGLLKKKGGGNISITMEEDDSGCTIIINDNGVGMSKDKLKEVLASNNEHGHGVKNVNLRLRNYFGSKLIITSEEKSGTSVKFHIK